MASVYLFDDEFNGSGNVRQRPADVGTWLSTFTNDAGQVPLQLSGSGKAFVSDFWATTDVSNTFVSPGGTIYIDATLRPIGALDNSSFLVLKLISGTGTPNWYDPVVNVTIRAAVLSDYLGAYGQLTRVQGFGAFGVTEDLSSTTTYIEKTASPDTNRTHTVRIVITPTTDEIYIDGNPTYTRNNVKTAAMMSGITRVGLGTESDAEIEYLRVYTITNDPPIDFWQNLIGTVQVE